MLNRAKKVLFVLAACLLPLVPLLNIRGGFYRDWYNHLWMSAYFAEFFSRHGVFPLVFNTQTDIGISMPMFYGYLFYPVFGLVGALLGQGLTVRVFSLGLFLAEYLLIRQVVKEAVHEEPNGSHWSKALIPFAVICATYPLTNLYNRSALTEFFATGLLTCVLCCLILLLFSNNLWKKIRYGTALTILLTAAAGFHPITALYGVFFLSLVSALFLYQFWSTLPLKRSTFIILLAGAVYSCVVLAPWIYISATQTARLFITQSGVAIGVASDSFDSIWARFAPFPWDPRERIRAVALTGEPVLDSSLVSGGTPYLDAQTNLPLLLLWAWEIWLLLQAGTHRIRTWLAPVLMWVFFSALSLSVYPYKLLPQVFMYAQFAYRLVAYQDLAALFGIFWVVRLNSKFTLPAGLTHARTAVLTICITLISVSLLTKWFHATAVRYIGVDETTYEPPANQRSRLLDLPASSYGQDQFSFGWLQEPLLQGKAVNFTVADGADFGRVKPAQVNFAKDGWVQTNVQSFAWNRLWVDGKRPNSNDLLPQGFRWWLRLSKGPHELEYRQEPDPTWLRLRRISLAAFFGGVLLLGLAGAGFRLWRFRPALDKWWQ